MPVDTAAVDEKKLHAFGEKLVTDMSAAFRSVLGYIGDRIGIFKALHTVGPCTVEELSQATGLNARYLQEWLAAMVAGSYVMYDPSGDKYSLSAETAAFLADEDSPHFSGGMMQMIYPLATVAPRIAECFKYGGGIKHDDHHPEMTEATERFTQPFVNHLLTQQWIPSMKDVHERLQSGGKVADLGCGAGLAALQIAQAYPNAEVWGYDNHAKSIERAQENARERGLKNIHFAVASMEDVSPAGSLFDFITTFDVIHDMRDPLAGLQAIRRLLKPDGAYFMLEMNAGDKLEDNIHPLGSLLYSISTLYCMTVSLAEGGAGLGTCMGPAKIHELAQQAGFNRCRKLPLNHPFSIMFELRP